ncbi:hypothetical protein [Ruminococcus flavefaciens]|uniref:hypothetical protein n=1 Tax=Ruminococcus flavefaciens TaxID=1265 RepID=UPI000465A09E|nr:hypothetical protein [Ruminococcus flavefaciens]
MKKRNIIITAAGVLTVSAALFTGFWIYQLSKPIPAGTADKVVVKPISSDIYSEEDYENAVNRVIDFFPEFENCNLLELRYAGDDKSLMETKNDQKTAPNEEIMVLHSDFYVNPESIFHTCNDAWNHDYTYKDWQWFLARTKDTDNWVITGYGYC